MYDKNNATTMSFTIDDLEQACRLYEAKYTGNTPCLGVRKMLAGMVQGTVPAPSKTLFPQTAFKRKPHHEDTTPGMHEDESARKYTKIEDLPIRQRSESELPMSDTKGMAVPEMAPDLGGGGGGGAAAAAAAAAAATGAPMNMSNPQSMKMVFEMNGLERRQEQFRRHCILQYRLSHQFGFIQKGHISKPWCPMPWSAVVWSWLVDDFCTSLIENANVTILLQGGAEVRMVDLIKYIAEIRTIIKQNIFLSSMDFPMLDALEQKVFLTFAVKEYSNIENTSLPSPSSSSSGGGGVSTTTATTATTDSTRLIEDRSSALDNTTTDENAGRYDDQAAGPGV